MVQRGTMFGAVIGYTGNAGSPIVTELALRVTTTDPVEAHVHVFGACGIVCDPISGGVVSLEGQPWLGPAHFDDSLTKGGHLIGGDEEGRKFRLGFRVHDKFDDLGESEEQAVIGWDG